MDMVYNHTMESEESNLNRIVPGYYYRLTTEGYFSNASACGNETASEREMVRKLIMDSVIYWAQEYHIDGFRFDLMGIHDIRTMNTIREALNRIDPGILVYGEGWTGGLSPLPDWERALKVNMTRLDAHIAAFSDNLRDGIKGSAFSAWERGFVSGREGMEETIKFGVVAATQHNQINYGRVYYSNEPWAAEPTQTINYASAHDNLTLWDKLRLSNATDSMEDRIKMNLLSAAILFTCQGIPFFQAGEEFLRSKPKNSEETEFEENSYRSPDFINSLKWDRISIFPQVYHYYKGMIAFRKAHKMLRMTRTTDIKANLRFLEGLEPNMVGYIIENTNNAGLDPNQDNILCESAAFKEEGNETICVIYNANRTEKTLRIPEGEWKVFVKGIYAGTDVLEVTRGGEITADPISAIVLVKFD
jgi:pullulanase